MRYFPIFFLLLFGCSPDPIASNSEETKVERDTFHGWHLVPVRDQFGDSSGVDVMGLFPGTFANSATLRDTLLVQVSVATHPDSGDSIFFLKMLEYGNIPVTFYEEKEIPIDAKNSTGIYSLTVSLYHDLIIDDKGQLYQAVTDAADPTKVYIDLSRGTSTQSARYSFAIDPAGLGEVLNK